MTLEEDALEKARDEVEFDGGGRWWRGAALTWAAERLPTPMPERVRIVDLTLREGEEYPDVIFTVEDKLALAELLIQRGFTELEVGYAGVIEEHAAAVRGLKERWPDIQLISHARAYARDGEWQSEVERSAEAGCDMLTFVASTSQLGLAVTPWLRREMIPERVAACVHHARACGMVAAFGLTDPIRTLAADLHACYHAAAEAGADRLYVYDGVGGATPEAMAGLVRAVRGASHDAIVGVHCHNTLGLATANALAAVRAGASVVDAVPLGLGDGAGITPTEEVVAALTILYGIETGISLDNLTALCREIAEAFQVKIPGHKAVVGKNLFRHQIDAHIAAIFRGHWYSWELVRPDALGQVREVEFAAGKIRPGRSGALGALLDRRGVNVTDEQLEAIVNAIRRRAAEQRIVRESEVDDIIAEVMG